jgi:hypothetical protein
MLHIEKFIVPFVIFMISKKERPVKCYKLKNILPHFLIFFLDIKKRIGQKSSTERKKNYMVVQNCC